jgi:hypothetical protein
MPLTDRAVNVLATMDGDIGNGKTPIVFICHSYGGLLVKQMLASGFSRAPEYRELVERFKGIVFLGTPNNGAGIAAFIGALKVVLRSSPAIAELKRNAPLLRDLSNWFKNNALDCGLKVRVFFETTDTYGVRVVDEDSADPHLPGVTPIGIDANHLEVCAPPSPDVRVKQSLALIGDVLNEYSDASAHNEESWIQRILKASDNDLPRMRRELAALLRTDPENIELQEAMNYLDQIRAHQYRARAHHYREFELIEHAQAAPAMIKRSFHQRLITTITILSFLIALVGALIGADYGVLNPWFIEKWHSITCAFESCTSVFTFPNVTGRDGSGNKSGTMSNIKFSVVANKPATYVAEWVWSGSGGTQKGSQTVIIELKSSSGTTVQTINIPLDRNGCYYQGHQEIHTGHLTVSAGSISGISVSITPVEGFQGPC